MLLNNYPGDGLGVGIDIGLLYAAWSGWPLCRISGTILTVTGQPVGKASTTPVMVDGNATIVSSWTGVAVTAQHAAADTMSGKIIGADKVQTSTNDQGYFELFVIKGVTATVSCPSFGKTITVDTTGHDTIDLSSYF